MEPLFSKRIEEAKERMQQKSSDLIILFPGPNMAYLTDIDVEPSERHFLMFIPREGETRFLAPELHSERMEDYEKTYFWSDDEDPRKVLEEVLQDMKDPEKVLLDDNMWETFSQDIRETLPECDFGLTSEILRDMRMVKTEDEIRNVREASNIADRVVKDVRDLGEEAIGMTEEELRDFIDERLERYGGEGNSFPTKVGAGPNGSKPHHEPSDSVIQSAEPVVLDFGCWKNGYPSDQTRTVVFDGEPDQEFREVFDIVRDAQQRAIEKVRPGIMTDEVDRAAREVIEDAGYGDEFLHRTGHGVGLEIHEHPKLPEIGEQIELREGMVFSVEPGIYIEGEFGVRIEDLVVVTEDGCERLNTTSRDF